MNSCWKRSVKLTRVRSAATFRESQRNKPPTAIPLPSTPPAATELSTLHPGTLHPVWNMVTAVSWGLQCHPPSAQFTLSKTLLLLVLNMPNKSHPSSIQSILSKIHSLPAQIMPNKTYPARAASTTNRIHSTSDQNTPCKMKVQESCLSSLAVTSLLQDLLWFLPSPVMAQQQQRWPTAMVPAWSWRSWGHGRVVTRNTPQK